MKKTVKTLLAVSLFGTMTLLAGCDDPQVYGSVGVSSGYSSYNGYRGGHRGGYGRGVRTSVSVGGRIY